MDITELYHFLFETPEGVGCLVGICLVLSLIVCVIMERRTRKRFADRPKGEDDWSIFDDDDEDEAEEVADYEQTISHSQLHHIGHADMPAAEDEKKDEE